MKFFKKLNMAGAAHIIAPLLVVVGAGLIGSYLLVASHADSTQVTCSANGKTINGVKEYGCSWVIPTPVIGNASINGQSWTGGYNDGSFSISSSNWVLCQQASSVAYYRGSYYNKWWAYTLSDQNTWGWVNATYGHGGVNNGSFANVPNCSGKYGTPPALASGTAPGAYLVCSGVSGTKSGNNFIIKATVKNTGNTPAIGVGLTFASTPTGGYDLGQTPTANISSGASKSYQGTISRSSTQATTAGYWLIGSADVAGDNFVTTTSCNSPTWSLL